MSPGEELSATLLRQAATLPSGTYSLTVVGNGHTLVVDGAGPGRVLVGKSEACQLRLDDPEVSRRHAALELVGRRLRVTDLGSTNGTVVDGVSVLDAWLCGGETLRVGSTTITVAYSSDGENPEVPFATAFGRVIGESRTMRRLYPLCDKLAHSTVSVIIEGETGTGKEALAESLHEQGDRAEGPFVVFDCTAVPPNLVESELFGHERGAFTGAIATRRGVFEQANGGTLLIDEIGDLDIAMQPKLLRVIERGEVRRVGGDRPLRVDVRVLCATRRDLDQQVQQRQFRDDLFHRLAVARVELPPLRDRQGDVTLLARHFWRALDGTGEPAEELLSRWEAWHWPGNVRELRNAVLRAVALGEEAALGALETVPTGAPDFLAELVGLRLPFAKARQALLEEFERRYLQQVLDENDGNVSKAARASGIARRHFQRIRARIGGS
jgi:transcriptional regulator with GAF, ATPase, and Fis domain